MQQRRSPLLKLLDGDLLSCAKGTLCKRQCCLVLPSNDTKIFLLSIKRIGVFKLENFMIERLMGLFWVGVQQFCFTCLKYAHDGIIGTVRMRRLLIFQVISFALLSAFCFDPELWGGRLWNALLINGVEFYEWTVRVALCGAMILFDSLLVLYFARIVRLHRHGLAAARPTLGADLAVAAFVTVLCCGYLYVSIASALRLRFDMDEYNWIGRFFIQISNFFYIALEVGGAFLAWSFLRRILRGKGERLQDAR